MFLALGGTRLKVAALSSADHAADTSTQHSKSNTDYTVQLSRIAYTDYTPSLREQPRPLPGRTAERRVLGGRARVGESLLPPIIS